MDDDRDETWYFEAPSKFLGAYPLFYGGSLSFDLKQDQVISQFEERDVVIESDKSLLWYDLAENPGLDWTSYLIPLDEGAGWNLDRSGRNANEFEIFEVLFNIKIIRIRGEFGNIASGVGSLDNVVLQGEQSTCDQR